MAVDESLRERSQRQEAAEHLHTKRVHEAEIALRRWVFRTRKTAIRIEPEWYMSRCLHRGLQERYADRIYCDKLDEWWDAPIDSVEWVERYRLQRALKYRFYQACCEGDGRAKDHWAAVWWPQGIDCYAVPLSLWFDDDIISDAIDSYIRATFVEAEMHEAR